MYAVYVENTLDGPIVYGPIENFDDAVNWAEQFPGNVGVYPLTKATYNAD